MITLRQNYTKLLESKGIEIDVAIQSEIEGLSTEELESEIERLLSMSDDDVQKEMGQYIDPSLCENCQVNSIGLDGEDCIDCENDRYENYLCDKYHSNKEG